MVEDALIAAVLENPGDDTPRLVYADWLEDRGDSRAEFLRVECELIRLPLSDERFPALQRRLQELHQTLDSDWVALVRQLPLNPLDELRRVLPPPKRPFRAGGDWTAIEAALGLGLPFDYKAYIAAYGSGVINGCLDIENPFHANDDTRAWWVNFAAFYHDLPEYGQVVPYPVFPQPGGLLPFGTLGDVDILNWLTVGEPDHWPFVYYDRTEGFFEIKGLTATEFVLEAVTQRSPLLIRLNSESVFDPPCDFESHAQEERCISLVHPRQVEIDSLADRLATRWPTDQVRIRRSPTGVRLLIESLGGSISLSSDSGDERTLASIRYDLSCALQVEEVMGELLKAGFTEISRW